MQILKPHEHIVLDALVLGIIPAAAMVDIKNDPNISSFKVTGNGYFLTIQHPELPKERNVFDTPMVVGECGGVKTGFVIFIENNELTFEWHGLGDDAILKDYREFNLQIKKV